MPQVPSIGVNHSQEGASCSNSLSQESSFQNNISAIESRAKGPAQNSANGHFESQGASLPKNGMEASAIPARASASGTRNQEEDGGMLLVGGKPGMYHCNYCMRDISSTCRIKCAHTETCPDWDLCVDCFGAGVELGRHKATHPYRVVDNTSFPVFENDWTATEELTTIAALEQHGMGNWGKVVELLDNQKDKTERTCMEHYIDLYLHEYGAILPKYTLVQGEPTETSLLMGENQEEYRMRPVTLEAYPEAVHLRDAPPQPPVATAYARERYKVKEKEKPLEIIPGYMPLRGDFDVEHDNEAELMLADMEISPEDDPAERQLKLMVVDVFNRKLTERERRKAFVREYGLVDYKALQTKERRRPREERELVAKLRIFARFQTPAEHEDFVQGVLEAKRLRKRIEQLQQYRRLGIRTHSEAIQYENEKRKREQELQMKKQRAEAGYLYESAKTGSKDRGSRYRKRARESELMMGEEDEGGKPKVSITAASDPGPLNIEEYPGAEMLANKEKELCGALRMLPKHYLFLKMRLFEEAQKAGMLKPQAPPRPSKVGVSGMLARILTLDVVKRKNVYNFLVQCGWVTARGGKTLPDIKASAVQRPRARGAAERRRVLMPMGAPAKKEKGLVKRKTGVKKEGAGAKVEDGEKLAMEATGKDGDGEETESEVDDEVARAVEHAEEEGVDVEDPQDDDEGMDDGG